jgi:hypothetical protein
VKLTHFFQFSCQKKQLHSEISSDIFMAAYCVQLTPSLPFKVWPCNQLVLARQINVETKKNTLRCKTNPGAGFHFQCAQNAVGTSRTCAEHGHHLLKAPESAVTATTQNSRPCRSFCPSSHVPRDVRTDTRACYAGGYTHTHERSTAWPAGDTLIRGACARVTPPGGWLRRLLLLLHPPRPRRRRSPAAGTGCTAACLPGRGGAGT